MLELDAASRYHHEVTRAFSKAAVICSSEMPAAALERVLGWSRRERTSMALLVDDETAPAIPESVLDAFDWIVTTGEAAWHQLAPRHSKRMFLARTATAVAYPLLALTSTYCYAHRQEGLSRSVV
jgi:2-oxoglutarate dehydrogenase complex dehydrogenase (E1) component-like enzyme